MTTTTTPSLSGWCSGPAGDQCHVNPCRSRTCTCPRREHHTHATPENPRARGEKQHEPVRETPSKVSAPLGKYVAVERDEGTWEVLGPDGTAARISGQVTWATEEAALRAERNGNRRKSVKESARQPMAI